MSEHKVIVNWKQTAGEDFLKRKYSRAHTWTFDGGLTIPASSSPSVVPLPYSDPKAVDPEEAFIAAVSSCHMLWFLSLAAEAGFEIQSYHDEAIGLMTKNETGALWISKITLHPKIVFLGSAPTPSELDHLHHRSHELCFIANSIKTTVLVA